MKVSSHDLPGLHETTANRRLSPKYNSLDILAARTSLLTPLSLRSQILICLSRAEDYES